jgi:hypothetical protein
VRTEVLFPMAQKIIRGTIRFVKAFLVVFQLLTLW